MEAAVRCRLGQRRARRRADRLARSGRVDAVHARRYTAAAVLACVASKLPASLVSRRAKGRVREPGVGPQSLAPWRRGLLRQGHLAHRLRGRCGHVVHRHAVELGDGTHKHVDPVVALLVAFGTEDVAGDVRWLVGHALALLEDQKGVSIGVLVLLAARRALLLATDLSISDVDAADLRTASRLVVAEERVAEHVEARDPPAEVLALLGEEALLAGRERIAQTIRHDVRAEERAHLVLVGELQHHEALQVDLEQGLR